MPLAARTTTDEPTEYMAKVHDDEPVPIMKRVTLLGMCSAATLIWLAFIAAAILADVYRDPDPIPRVAIWVFVVIGLVLIQGTMFAGLRDWNDRRNQAVEQRIRTYVQHETYMLTICLNRCTEQIAMLRGELRGLLGQLPEKIRAFGDEREDQGEARAVRRLTAASGTDGPAGVASVSYLHTAPHRT